MRYHITWARISRTALFCLLLVAATAVVPRPAVAAPDVVTDIRPVHGLVAAIMDGAGAPVLIDESGGSPHAAALRPGSARALQEADLFVWVGPQLTPWIARAADTLARDAARVTLAEVPGTLRLPARPRGHGGGDPHAHGDAPLDPHMWLDPRNAAAWAGPIAAALAEADPDNAALYAANAEALLTDLAALEAELRAELAPVADVPFAVLHDAFAYFEHRFALNSVGALSLSDAAAPGPQGLRDLRARIDATGAACVFAEPQTRRDLIRALTDGLDVSTGVLDPLGLDVPTGPGQYQATLRAMARSIMDCLGA